MAYVRLPRLETQRPEIFRKISDWDQDCRVWSSPDRVPISPGPNFSNTTLATLQSHKAVTACGCCASTHTTCNCKCPAAMECTAPTSCRHVQPKCVACEGPHPASHVNCPAQKGVLDHQMYRLAGTGPLNFLCTFIDEIRYLCNSSDSPQGPTANTHQFEYPTVQLPIGLPVRATQKGDSSESLTSRGDPKSTKVGISLLPVCLYM